MPTVMQRVLVSTVFGHLLPVRRYVCRTRIQEPVFCAVSLSCSWPSWQHAAIWLELRAPLGTRRTCPSFLQV
jgi:hypothetical protein